MMVGKGQGVVRMGRIGRGEPWSGQPGEANASPWSLLEGEQMSDDTVMARPRIFRVLASDGESDGAADTTIGV